MKPLFKPTTQKQTHSKSGIAFIIEALLLLVLIAGSLAVLVSLFNSAHMKGEENSQTVRAIQLASDQAEQFSAQPTKVADKKIDNDLVVITGVSDQKKTTGTLYLAKIGVYDIEEWYTKSDPEPIYEIDTARYVKAGGA